MTPDYHDFKDGYNNTFDKKSIRDFIEFADHEEESRDYFVASSKKYNSELHYIVTNKRVITFLWSEKSIDIQSVRIVDIVSTAVYKTKYSFAITINIKASTGALIYNSSTRGLGESVSNGEDLKLKVNSGPDLARMAYELGALILNLRTKLSAKESG
jgi:hypothetical protein